MLIDNHRKLIEENYARRYKDIFLNHVDKKTHDRHLFLGLADMDWRAPDSMIDDIVDIVKEGAYNYCYCHKDINTTIRDHFLKEHNIKVELSKITIGNGVIHLVQCAIHTFTKPGDGIIIQTPGYSAFFHITESNNRVVVENKMLWDEQKNKFVIDWLDLEEKMKHNKFMIWCSPHNPTGRVWEDWENKKLIALSKKYDVLIVSDEIWKDIVYSPNKHIPLNAYDYDKTFVVSSIGKTYNIGSLQFGYGISNNFALVEAISILKDKQFHIASHNRFTIASLKSGYNNPETISWWKNEMLPACKKNRDYFTKKLQNTHFKLSVPEGTYVYWMDFSKYINSAEQLEVLMDEINATFSNGIGYRGGFEKWARFTFAVNFKSIKQLVDKLLIIHQRYERGEKLWK